MPKKMAPAKLEQEKKNEAVIQAEKLLEELVAEDPRLRVAREHARKAGSDDGTGQDSVQIYRQRLRE